MTLQKNGITLALSVLALLTACSAHTHRTGQASADPSATAPQKTIFNPYLQDINKAKQVQATLEAEQQKTERQIQAQSGADAAQPAPAKPPQR